MGPVWQWSLRVVSHLSHFEQSFVQDGTDIKSTTLAVLELGILVT